MRSIDGRLRVDRSLRRDTVAEYNGNTNYEEAEAI
jgi:hypothetical protein